MKIEKSHQSLSFTLLIFIGGCLLFENIKFHLFRERERLHTINTLTF